MDHFKVDLVVHGTTDVSLDIDGSDPYAVRNSLLKWIRKKKQIVIIILKKEPKKQSKFKIINSGNPLTTANIVERIISHRCLQ